MRHIRKKTKKKKAGVTAHGRKRMKERAGAGGSRGAEKTARRVKKKGFAREECDGPLRKFMDGVWHKSGKSEDGARNLYFYGSQVWLFGEGGTLVTVLKLKDAFVSRIYADMAGNLHEDAYRRYLEQEKRRGRTRRDADEIRREELERQALAVIGEKCPDITVTGTGWLGDKELSVRYVSDKACNDAGDYFSAAVEARKRTGVYVKIRHARHPESGYMTKEDWEAAKSENKG